MDLARLQGRINDLDSHLMVPARRYPEVIGAAGEELARRFANSPAAPFFDPPEGEVELSQESVWNVKGVRAPGAGTVEGRLRALDVMGIDRQLVFPQVLVCALVWGRGPQARDVMRAYNDFAVGWTRDGRGRLRAVALLRVADLEETCAEARRVIDAGARAVLIPDGVPPGGVSPADASVDRLWAMLAEARVPVLLHIGGQAGFIGSRAWGAVETLRSAGMAVGEPVDPHLMSTVHMSPQNYIQTLIMGGVFERHPELRFAAIELGAHWVGPMAELLDTLAGMRFAKRMREGLRMKPSEYLRRNVRVTPFIHEDIGAMIGRHGLPEVYAFSTDFPHPEGGTDPIERMSASVAPLGDAAVERLLVENAEWIVPA